MVRQLPKLNVEGSSPFARSNHPLAYFAHPRGVARFCSAAQSPPVAGRPEAAGVQGSARKGRWTGERAGERTDRDAGRIGLQLRRAGGGDAPYPACWSRRVCCT